MYYVCYEFKALDIESTLERNGIDIIFSEPNYKIKED
jgi:hypothetical protein